MKPLVTLRINSYNHVKFLRESVEGAVNQTYSNIEIIAVDDGSQDGSGELLTELGEIYGFKVLVQENKGFPETLNMILNEHTKGKYIIGTAGDDILMPDVVEKYVEAMENYPEWGMCFGNAYKIDENSNIIGEIQGSHEKGFLLKDVALGKCKLPLMTLMWRVQIFEKIGYYEKNIVAEDTYMQYKVLKNYEVGHVNTFTKKYRTHCDNQSKDEWKMYETSLKVIDLYKNESFFKEYKIDRYTKLFYLLSKNYKKESLKFFGYAIRRFYSKYFILGVLRFVGLDMRRN